MTFSADSKSGSNLILYNPKLSQPLIARITRTNISCRESNPTNVQIEDLALERDCSIIWNQSGPLSPFLIPTPTSTLVWTEISSHIMQRCVRYVMRLARASSSTVSCRTSRKLRCWVATETLGNFCQVHFWYLRTRHSRCEPSSPSMRIPSEVGKWGSKWRWRVEWKQLISVTLLYDMIFPYGSDRMLNWHPFKSWDDGNIVRDKCGMTRDSLFLLENENLFFLEIMSKSKKRSQLYVEWIVGAKEHTYPLSLTESVRRGMSTIYGRT